MADDDLGDRLPRTLGDVVRKNRHLFEVGLATKKEIAKVTGKIDLAIEAEVRIENWRIIAYRYLAHGRTTLHLAGMVSSGVAQLTRIEVLDRDGSRMSDGLNIYELGDPATSPPGILMMFHVGDALRRGGENKKYDLDVLDVWY